MTKHPKFSAGSKGAFSVYVTNLVNTEYFHKNGIEPHGNAEMYSKTVILLTAFFSLYFVILFGMPPPNTPWWLCVTEGITIAGIGFCIMHDAIHGSYSANPTLNTILGFSLNMEGGVNFVWKNQHNILHHTYSNIDEHDHDIEVKYIMRFSPNQDWYIWQRLQFLYVIPVYSIYYFLWIFILDPMKYYSLWKEKGDKFETEHHWNFWLSKLFFITMWIIVPRIVLGFYPWRELLIIGMTCSFIISLIFQLAHTVEGTEFPLPNPAGKMENEIAVHAVVTTSNFSPRSRIIDWFVGGLNYQVEHHLFPGICHVHYKYICKYVKQACKDFGLPYNCNNTLIGAIWSHFVFLFKMGNPKGYSWNTAYSTSIN